MTLEPLRSSQDLSDCNLIVASDIPEGNRSMLDFFGMFILNGMWYWAWVETLTMGRDRYGALQFEPYYHIESGPVSPLTFEAR